MFIDGYELVSKVWSGIGLIALIMLCAYPHYAILKAREGCIFMFPLTNAIIGGIGWFCVLSYVCFCQKEKLTVPALAMVMFLLFMVVILHMRIWLDTESPRKNIHEAFPLSAVSCYVAWFIILLFAILCEGCIPQKIYP